MKQTRRNARHLSTQFEKVEFLSRHPELWKRSELEIRNALVAAKLVSVKTYIGDLHIPYLVEKARKL